MLIHVNWVSPESVPMSSPVCWHVRHIKHLLRSQLIQQIIDIWFNLSTAGDRSFHINAPHAWNDFPKEIHALSDLPSFNKCLKIYYFKLAFSLWHFMLSATEQLLWNWVLYKWYYYYYYMYVDSVVVSMADTQSKSHELKSTCVPRAGVIQTCTFSFTIARTLYKSFRFYLYWIAQTWHGGSIR